MIEIYRSLATATPSVQCNWTRELSPQSFSISLFYAVRHTCMFTCVDIQIVICSTLVAFSFVAYLTPSHRWTKYVSRHAIAVYDMLWTRYLATQNRLRDTMCEVCTYLAKQYRSRAAFSEISRFLVSQCLQLNVEREIFRPPMRRG